MACPWGPSLSGSGPVKSLGTVDRNNYPGLSVAHYPMGEVDVETKSMRADTLHTIPATP